MIFRGALLAFALAVLTVPARGEDALRRIASINLCTDQLLLALADRDQIAGLSPYARAADRAFLADAAKGLPLLSGEAEDVLMLQPDLVLTASFGRRETRALLQASGLKVLALPPALSIEETRQQIRTVAAAIGHPDRGEAAVARIDAALVRARSVAAEQPLRILSLSRRGWVAGGRSITTDMLRALGLRNAADDLGFPDGGFASLEAIIAAKPDLLLVEEPVMRPEDQGQGFLVHPALTTLYPARKRLLMPERLVTCGGPMLADALDLLARELQSRRASQ